jgi:ubiquinone/menaquinone biosynthesis C-methylase UbiE
VTRLLTPALFALVLPGCTTSAASIPAAPPVPISAADTTPAPEAPPASSPEAAPAETPAIGGAPASINEGWVETNPEKASKTLEKKDREVFAHRHAVTAVLRLRAGERVADIGAGTGFFVKLFAEQVGPEGRVYAIDIAPALVDGIESWANADRVEQVRAILGTADDPKLEAGSVDAVFICDTYHHFEDPATLMGRVKSALQPGGRLYVLDFERIPGTSPDWIVEHVRAGKETVVEELISMGFVFVKEHEIEGLVENYFVEFRAP